MEISNAHHQAMASHQLDQVLAAITYHHHQQQQEAKVRVEKKPAGSRPHPDQALRCPRCDSSNTKFCYYNNYSLSQPRYFCRACRRYWTHGGSLRNVPVGGGCRKNRKPSSKKLPDQPLPVSAAATTFTTNPNPNSGLLDILNGYNTNCSSNDGAYYMDQTAAATTTAEGYWIDHGGSSVGPSWNSVPGSYWLANGSLM